MKTSIALIGFMGTGKTAVGQALAAWMGKDFIEMDALIALKAGKPIPQIFREDGEILFRALEIEVTKEIALRKNAVIACGGGVVLNQINIDRLRQECRLVYLTADPEVILRRTLADPNERPLLQGGGGASRIREMLRLRRPFYERAADITVDTSELDIDAVAERIIQKLEEHESNTGKE